LIIVEPILARNFDFACAREARAGTLSKNFYRTPQSQLIKSNKCLLKEEYQNFRKVSSSLKNKKSG